MTGSLQEGLEWKHSKGNTCNVSKGSLDALKKKKQSVYFGIVSTPKITLWKTTVTYICANYV